MVLSLIVDEHRQYLADDARISAYRRAIHEVVHPGDVVVDLGAGTGILGLLACEAGAKRVFFTDARKGFLKPGGVMTPSRVDLCVAPVECPEMWDQVEFWNNSSVGFNLRPARSLAVNTRSPVKLLP